MCDFFMLRCDSISHILEQNIHIVEQNSNYIKKSTPAKTPFIVYEEICFNWFIYSNGSGKKFFASKIM